VLLVYRNGGPDHRPTFMPVQRALMYLFLILDLDYLCAVLTPPGHSWRNPAERIMSFRNVGLQIVEIMRTQCSDDLETTLRKCNNIKDIRSNGTSNPEIQVELNNSLRELQTLLLGSAFSNQKLKIKPFRIFNPSSKEAIEKLWSAVQTVDDSFQPTDMTVKQVENKIRVMGFFPTHCR